MTETSPVIVRKGIAQYFGGTVYDLEARAYRGAGPLLSSGLSTVRAYVPKRVSDKDYVLGQAAGRAMGAFMEVGMPSDVERREALGGATSGIKLIRYRTVLNVFHLARKSHAEDAQEDIDVLREAIKSHIRADRTLGGIVFQAGESAFGIQTRVEPSIVHNEVTGTLFTVTFEADVHIVA